MTQKPDLGIALILREHDRELLRWCRRKYGSATISPAMLLEAAIELMNNRIGRLSRRITDFSEQIYIATQSVDQLAASLLDLRARKRKGKRHHGKR